MRIEDQLVSLNLSIQLKALGVKQDSLYRYAYHATTDKLTLKLTDQSYHENDVAAFTVAELIALLPVTCTFSKYTGGRSGTKEIGYKVRYYENDNYGMDCCKETLAEACASMLIYLIENKLLEVTDECHASSD